MEFDYKLALYRRDNKGQPNVWYARVEANWYIIYHGIVGKTIQRTTITSSRNPVDEVQSKINEKRKQGYKYLSELKDNNTLPVEGELLSYLNTYLPFDRTTSEGILLPMLAKTFDNENNKVFKKVSNYYGQWKINGLRCSIGAKELDAGLFNERCLVFTSREGTVWTSLSNLEEYLLANVIKGDILYKMLYEGWELDGELYLPGYSVNDINHFVKDRNCIENTKIQYWCYDIKIPEASQTERYDIMDKYLNKHLRFFNTKEEHLNNTDRFVLLPLTSIFDEEIAITTRNKFIDLGFEGLIMRNPAADYQFGKRNMSMIKFKKSTDGKFIIVDIKPEGLKRPDIPLFVCKNDINDSEFECHCGGTFEYQKQLLKDKDKYIGKYMYVEYGERSGIEQLPFHVKTTYIIND